MATLAAWFESERVRRTVIAVTAVLGVLTVAIVAYRLAGGGETGPVDAGMDVALTQPRTDLPSTTGDSLPAGPIGVDPIDVEVLGLRFALPDSWVVAAPGSGATGAQLIPDDPAAATRFDQELAQVTPGALLFAIDKDPRTASNLQVFLQGPEVGELDDVVSIVRGVVALSDITIELDAPTGFGELRGHRLQSTFHAPDGESRGIQLHYIVELEGVGVFILVFNTLDAATAALIDGVVRPSLRAAQ